MKRIKSQEDSPEENIEKVTENKCQLKDEEYEDATMKVCQKKNGGEWEIVEVTYRRKKKEESVVRSKVKTKVIGA